MHAFLIAGADEKTRNTLVEELLNTHGVAPYNRSLLVLAEAEATIGITAVRSWQQNLFLSPIGSGVRAGVIPQAELLTREAQQAMLKILEEPPGSSIVILSSVQPFALLPTIVSRCQLIIAAPIGKKRTNARVLPGPLSPGNAFATAEHIAGTRVAAETWLMELLKETPVTPKSAGLLRAASRAYEQLSANVTPRLVIDQFLLSLSTGQA